MRVKGNMSVKVTHPGASARLPKRVYRRRASIERIFGRMKGYRDG